MYILGLSAFYHDSAACLLKDGKIIAAAQEERFTRIKHDWSYPKQSVEYCLVTAGITPSEIATVVFYDKPFLKFERILETHLAYAPKSILSFLKGIPSWVKEKVWVKDTLSRELQYQGQMLFPEHHMSHAASAFYPSPFNEAAILTVDGVGEWATTSIGVGKGNEIKLIKEIRFPHSLGLLYSAFTYFTGFKVNSGEYKLMGLAPYGQPRFKEIILDKLIDLRDDGSFRLNMDYFNYGSGFTMTNNRFAQLFEGPRRLPESEITQREMDLAKSVQEVIEEAVIRIGRHVKNITGAENLCMAGGVALNCVSNGKLHRENLFKNIWVQPAAGDAGGALGAAFYGWHAYHNKPRHSDEVKDQMQGSYLGPEFSDSEILKALDEADVVYNSTESEELLVETVCLALSEEKVVGWFQGRMEFGPRALGNRSILGDARSPKLQEVMNLKIKFRESFRPFAPIIKEDVVSEYFDMDYTSPYMLFVAPVQKRLRIQIGDQNLFGIEKLKVARSTIPAVTHVDYSARIQTVSGDSNPLLYSLLDCMHKNYGIPVLINTSFNVRGEPIVTTPRDAVRCFLRTGMDILVLGSYILRKDLQKNLTSDDSWKKEYQLD